MNRRTFTFEEFEQHFINNPDGFLTVYAAFKEDEESKNLRAIHLDMICEWRLPDGKIIFIEVPFETEEQFNKIVEYLKITTELLRTKIMDNIKQLNFADTVS